MARGTIATRTLAAALILSLAPALAPPKALAENAAPKPQTPVRRPRARPQGVTEHLRGEVVLVRGKVERRVSGETAVTAGDWLRTGRDGSVRVTIGDLKADLAPASVVRLRAGRRGLAIDLVYGHARLVGVGTFEAGAGDALLRHANGPKAVLYLHVTRDERELSERLGGTLADPPKAPGRRFVEVECAADDAVVAARAHAHGIPVKAGDVLRIEGGAADFAPIAAGADQIRANAEALGFGPAE